MNFDRARDIVDADTSIKVLLNGSPVWIEELDVETNSAKVRPLDGTKITEVPVAELVEARFM